MCKKYEIYTADLNPVKGSEQGGFRPVLVIQNDKGNMSSPTTIVAVITTASTKRPIPTHVWLDPSCGLSRESMVLCEQIRTIDKTRFKRKVGEIHNAGDKMAIEKALLVSFGIGGI